MKESPQIAGLHLSTTLDTRVVGVNLPGLAPPADRASVGKPPVDTRPTAPVLSSSMAESKMLVTLTSDELDELIAIAVRSAVRDEVDRLLEPRFLSLTQVARCWASPHGT